MTKEREKELLDKIAALEARVKALEAQPKGETHFHYHQPLQAPQPIYQPPWTPWCIGSGAVYA